MYLLLKRLELQGFKSFADKTILEFVEGSTAVVGPNGSGKSNISDAIRWVIGEMSAKSLRGSNMQDVIFAGTETRKPVNFAEVSLVLDNSSHLFDINYDEVVVTRRLFRSGESVYQINRSNCRLKDIHELFMDTGLGRDGYSIIGQGNVSQILSTKAEDRRSLFEEAAGISKYKYRREEAERKLKGVEENLVRISDITTELEGQRGPLKRQSEKARKYLTYYEEYKGLDVNLNILSIVAPYFINVLLALPSEIYGIVEGVCVLGMILGGFWISIKPKMFSMNKVHYTYYPMISGVILMSILGFIKINNYAMAAIFAFGGLLIMLSLSLSNVLTLTFIQKQVPANMLGRVSAFSVAVATISVAPGQLLYGQLIDIGVPLGIILIVTVIFNIILILFIKKNVSNTVVVEDLCKQDKLTKINYNK